MKTVGAKIINMTCSTWKPRYFDIGVNFSDSMFQGFYHHSTTRRHPEDIDKVIDRAHLFNVKRMLITASTIKESEEHFQLCEKYPNNFTSTAGVHPCLVAQEFYHNEELADDYQDKLDHLKSVLEIGHAKGYVKAFGEIGLDYDRLHFSSKIQQLTMFKKQLEVVASLKHLKIPLFLHMRAACDDFISILKPFLDDGSIERGNGVIHSFTGTEDELRKLQELGFYFSLNGCSLKTEENLEVAALIPISQLMIETDAPWCEVRKSHASYKYITPYPNKFYPMIEAKKPEEVEEPVQEPAQETQKPMKQKKKSPPPKQQIKLHELLPFPVIKQENFEKHKITTNKLIESHQNPDSIDYATGEFAYPLIKSRNEPVFVGNVAEILCKVHGITEDRAIEEFIDMVYENSCRVFKV
jgi:TatD DNase family protein